MALLPFVPVVAGVVAESVATDVGGRVLNFERPSSLPVFGSEVKGLSAWWLVLAVLVLAWAVRRNR